MTEGNKYEAVFLSTRPRGARHRHTGRASKRSCFYPRARGGRDKSKEAAASAGKDVSIHAPAGGATIATRFVRCNFGVSIHAPAGGATGQRRPHHPAPRGFYPRARGGRDRRGCCQSTGQKVSIHAPAGGATAGGGGGKKNTRRFYPRARGGRDRLDMSSRLNSKMFLSTRPRGARQLYPKRLEITKL